MLQDYLRSPLLVDEKCYARTSTLQSCHRLLAEGGSDYDFEQVNSGTVFAVLLGLHSHQFPKVVPNDSSTKSMFFAIYSHGNCHPNLSPPGSYMAVPASIPLSAVQCSAVQNRTVHVSTCAIVWCALTITTASLIRFSKSRQYLDAVPTALVEQRAAEATIRRNNLEDTEEGDRENYLRVVPPDIPSHENEWFAHFPYPCEPPEYRELMYAFVSTDGGRTNGHKAPECQLYATHIAMIVTRLCHHQHHQRAPQPHPRPRPVVGLLNFCRSGGGLDFMRREGFRSFYQVW